MKEKIIFIGHGYHKKTKSNQFLLDYLSEFYDIEIVYDESWNGGEKLDFSYIDDRYKAVIFWQFIPENVSEKVSNKNIIYFPMYDAVSGLKSRYWYQYRNLKIISFSYDLYKNLKSYGISSVYIKYFPEPKNFCPGNNNEVFFWQRLTEVNFNTISTILQNYDFKIHIHKALDPNNSFIQPTKTQEKEYQITYSDWFASKEKLLEIVTKKTFYIAPRFKEGIGMSFLEAMAMGKIVIANDKPVMNEYIINGKTGILCNFKKPKSINISNIEEMQKNAYQFIQKGYREWCNNRKEIINVINSDYEVQVNCIKLSINLMIELMIKKIEKVRVNIRCWLVFNKSKKDEIRGRTRTKVIE